MRDSFLNPHVTNFLAQNESPVTDLFAFFNFKNAVRNNEILTKSDGRNTEVEINLKLFEKLNRLCH